MRKYISHIITFLLGITLGVLIGMLFSPTRGATTRSLLFYQIKKLAHKIKMLFIQLIYFPHATIAHNHAKATSQAVINETMRKAKRLLKEATELSEQLDANNATS